MIPVSEISKKIPSVCNIKLLKKGGQKSVYTGRHDYFGDIVLKLVFIDETEDRVLREIDIVKEINIPNVPLIHEYGTKEIENQKILYLIEQNISGNDLRSLLNNGYKFTSQEVLKFVTSLVQISVELEKKSIVHRDIKPENIILDSNGEYWLLDFGIARNLKLPSLTATNAHFGPFSLGYAAPEQISNMKKSIDSRSDLFSIGTVAYELLTGKNPFTDGAQCFIDVINRTNSYSAPDLERTSRWEIEMSKLIKAMMQKSPVMRPPSAKVAHEWLEVIVANK